MHLMIKSALGRCLIMACVVSSSGCAKAEQWDARRDHILAGDHGWIDLTLKTPLAQLPDADHAGCHISYGFNGEELLSASADLKEAQANQILVGYRFPAPSGALNTSLHISFCVKEPVVVKLPLDLKKDHLAELEFDGTTVVVKRSIPYEPTSLEWVRTQILQLQTDNGASSMAVSTLTKIALASLGLNFLVLLLLLWKWRARTAKP
jgi:hypothetical protein